METVPDYTLLSTERGWITSWNKCPGLFGWGALLKETGGFFSQGLGQEVRPGMHVRCVEFGCKNGDITKQRDCDRTYPGQIFHKDFIFVLT